MPPVSEQRRLADLEVRASTGPYRVRFEPGAVARFVPGLREHVVVDRALRLSLAGAVAVDAGEALKSLKGVEALATELLRRGARPGDTLVAIGGATVSDTVAFVAATFARGLAWRFLPTTLLAQADACVGGKSAINVAGAKNVLGTITPPREVVVDADALATLPQHAVRSGLGEILKAHALAGPRAFDDVVAALAPLDARPAAEALTLAVRASLDVKRGYVEADEHDQGARRHLNLGHTFGHALEGACGLDVVPHGVAVAWGMQVANRVAVARGWLPAHHAARMRPALEALVADVPPVDVEAILAGVRADKKRRTARVHLILLCGEDAHPEERELDDDAALADQLRSIMARPWTT